jgi:NADH:ubiquinone oxidoreductase subunit K
MNRGGCFVADYVADILTNLFSFPLRSLQNFLNSVSIALWSFFVFSDSESANLCTVFIHTVKQKETIIGLKTSYVKQKLHTFAVIWLEGGDGGHKG